MSTGTYKIFKKIGEINLKTLIPIQISSPEVNDG